MSNNTLPSICQSDLQPLETQKASALAFSTTEVIYWHDASIKLGKLSVFCAAISGAKLNEIKADCQQGEWQRVVKDLPFSTETARVYRTLANELQERIDAKGHSINLLSLPDPSELLKPEYSDTVDLVREMTGDKSIRQLCFDWGILKQPKNPGGDTTGKGTEKPLPPGETSQHLMATGLLGKLQHEINVLVVTEYSQIIKHLDERELKDLFDTFALAAKAIDSQMKAL